MGSVLGIYRFGGWETDGNGSGSCAVDDLVFEVSSLGFC
jgi:hypothetical protein